MQSRFTRLNFSKNKKYKDLINNDKNIINEKMYLIPYFGISLILGCKLKICS